MKSELDIARKLLAVGDLFDGERKPAGGDIAEIDGRIDELLKFLEGESTKRKDKRDAGRMDSAVDELAGLHELRQMMELATEDGAGDK